jgi:mono/diheme cytochrome c family protein/glucose/arabinose dehydrogenase
MNLNYSTYFFLLIISIIVSCEKEENFSSHQPIPLKKNDHIALIGNNLCSRMINYDYFETELQLRNPTLNLTIRNMCDGGDTPGFRPHSSRFEPWAFPGAEKFYAELANKSDSEGHYGSPDEWLTSIHADYVIAFFGYVESFNGIEDLPRYKSELQAFITHTQKQKYNSNTPPVLVLVSPIAFEDLSEKFDLPNGVEENKNLEAYTNAMQEIAKLNNVPFINTYTASKSWYKDNEDLTIDGFQLNDKGYKIFGNFLADQIYGGKNNSSEANQKLVFEAVKEKNWYWHNDVKVPNGVHVYGRRYEPFGSENYPSELKKIKELTTIRDTAIWSVLSNKNYDVKSADSKTTALAIPKTNFNPQDKSLLKYLYGDEAISKFKVADGFKIALFASEKEFPDLANPVQLSFDDRGRLWVAVMPEYPHYRPGDAKPNDKLLILEDTNNDGKADKQTIFADKLHLPIGFEFAPEGVYLSQGTNLKLLTDTNGDDKADKEEIILSGFDDHDTHHAISAFCADPSGSIFMAEGTFLHTNVETPYGTSRGTNGGFFRYNPSRKHLERVAQLAIPNPWGIAFDDWGQNIFAETSGPDVRWMMPGSIKPVYGKVAPASPSLFEESHRVRPTSGLEFVSSRHFPDEMQGDLLINNTIGFLGMKQHTMTDEGTGFASCHRQDLVTSSDGNFRPVDMEFAPDGSLYLVDWHNMLIGHMQHNARDPLRDHVHGRIYRITHTAKPLVVPPKVYEASIPELLDNLKLPEYRTRYRTKRALRGKNHKEVLTALDTWVKKLDPKEKNYEHHLLEGLWVSWGLNKVDQSLLQKLLNAKDFRARAAAVRVLRYSGHQIANQAELLSKAAADEHGRVRLEAIVTSSWLDKKVALPILAIAAKKPLDDWMQETYKAVIENFESRIKKPDVSNPNDIVSGLTGKNLELFQKGRALYSKDGYCNTCHQPDGRGLYTSGYPPLANSKWVNEDPARLIKLTLNGIMGPMEVNGKNYEGKTPMIPYGGLLNDEEVAAVLTFIRNSFGNRSSPILAETVKKVRQQIKDKKGYYNASDLLKEHPHKKVKG